MYSQIKIKSVRNVGSGPYHWKQAETNGISKEHYNHSEGKKERKSGIGRRERRRNKASKKEEEKERKGGRNLNNLWTQIFTIYS